ncbi:MAG: hypothetical protein H7251_03575 [Acetobacteraceae bacterium]|nr:hypothetical protein [Acetobacteraceae bacterium]
MLNFSAILSDLQAAIAVRTARDRRLTVLLVAMWARIGRMRTRLERLVAHWRAGTRPVSRMPGTPRPAAQARAKAVRPIYPIAPAWLVRRLGYDAAAFGLQLRHLLAQDECAEFLAAMPQAGRILRPLLRLLSTDPLPEVICKAKSVFIRPVVAAMAAMAECVVAPGLLFSDD